MSLDIALLLILSAVFLAVCAVLRFNRRSTTAHNCSSEANKFRSKTISWFPLGCIAVLLVGSVFGHEFFNIKFGPLPVTLDRVLLGCVMLAFAWQYLNHRQEIAPLNWVDIGILAWLAMITISTFTHKFTIMNNMPLSRLLFFNWLPVLLYVMVRWCRIESHDLKTFSVVMVVFGIYLALLAIVETRGMHGFVFPSYILDSEYREFLGRGRGPFLNPVTNGIVLSVSICCALMWWPRMQTNGRVILFVVASLLSFGVYSTFTRSTWLGLAAGMAIFVFWPSKQQQKGAMIVVATLAAIVLFPVISEKIFSFKRDQEVTQAEMEQSAQMRPLFASVAMDMFGDRPLFGVGFAQYPKTKYPYLQNPHSNLPLKSTRSLMQHNVFLAYLVDMGLIGLGFLIFLLAQFFRASWQVWSNRSLNLWARQFGLASVVLLIGYCINGLFHDVSIIPMQHMFLFFWLGVVNNIYSRPSAFQLEGPETIRGPWQSPSDQSIAA